MKLIAVSAYPISAIALFHYEPRAVKIFQREQRSLFGEILDWMLTPLLLLWPVSLALTWLVAQGLANKPFDRALEYNAHALAQLVTVQQRQQGAVQPAPACQRDPARRRLRHRLLPGDRPGARNFSRASAIAPARRRRTLRPRRSAPARCRAARRGHSRGLHLGAAGAARCKPLALVQVAETREKRSVLATEIIKGVMLPQFVILPLAVLLVWLALARGISR
jgi:two-component system sensor histidine kinase TctE